MKDVLSAIIETSYFSCPVFDGKIVLKGRVLSPAEAEQAGVIQFMVASQLMDSAEDYRKMERLQDAQKQDSEEDLINEVLQGLKSSNFQPEMLERINHANDKIICQVVKSASLDSGGTWEPIRLVLSADQQSAEQNRLWIGTLQKEDREALLDKALNGYKEGRKKLKKFFR
jgi:hypothetical protein